MSLPDHIMVHQLQVGEDAGFVAVSKAQEYVREGHDAWIVVPTKAIIPSDLAFFSFESGYTSLSEMAYAVTDSTGKVSRIVVTALMDFVKAKDAFAP